MTIASATTREIFACNGATTVRTVPFKILDESHLRIVKYTIADGTTVDLTLNTDYTVGAVGDANCTFTTIGGSSPYSSAYKLIALLDVPLSQEEDYVANDAFPAESHEDALDKLTLVAQQHDEQLSRAALLPEFSDTALSLIFSTPVDGYGLVWDGSTGTLRNTTSSLTVLEAQADALYAIAADISTVAAIDSDVTAVAGNAADISTVAGISGYVATVGAIAASVVTVAGITANIATVAGISANVTTVAGISSSVTTVAGLSTQVTGVYDIRVETTGVYNIRTDVTTVAGISANVTTVAGISADVTTVAGDHAAIVAVAADLTKIDAVYADLTAIDGVYAIRANVTTVAGIQANVTTVAGISTSVSTVAGIQANVTTVAGIQANVTTVAGLSSQITTLALIADDITDAANNIPKAKRDATIAPTVNDDVSLGYSVGSLWFDVNADAAYLCLDATDGAASWQQVTTAATSAAAITFNSSGLVYTAANNVQPAISDLDGALAGVVAGLSPKASCRVATTGALTVLYAAGVLTNNGALAALQIDGVNLATGERVLVKDQASALQNGWYSVTTVGSGAVAWVMTRTADADATGEIVEGNYSIIEEGTTNVGTLWIQTHTGTITIGTTAVDFTQLKITAVAASALTGTTLASNVVTSSLTAVGTVVTGVWSATAVGATKGGTGATTVTQGDILYGSAADTWSKLAAGTSGQFLKTLGAGANPAWADVQTARKINTGTAGITIDGTDWGKVVELTGSTARTFAITAAATLTNGWWCITKNSSTAELTLDGNGSELDGLANYISYPGEVRLLQCTGSVINSTVLHPFDTGIRTTTFNFILPPGYSVIDGFVWGSGASGGKGATNGGGGGGGGSCVPFSISASKIGAAGTSTTCTVGAGGISQTTANTAGNAGNSSTFGTFFTGYGGGRGGGSNLGAGGGGGGNGAYTTGSTVVSGVGGDATTTTGGTGGPSQDGQGGGGAAGTTGTINGGAGGGNSTNAGAGYGSMYGGGSGAAAVATTGGLGGYSNYGGGGGGGASNTTPGAGGLSKFGGAGGAGATGANNATDGSAPAGGGGGCVTGNSGAGGAGGFRIIGKA